MTSVGFPDLTPTERYKLLCATVVPRPIALVTSVDPDGVANAAPISFYNVFSEDPAWIVLGLQHRPGRVAKDTSRNIAETGVFVVNAVDEDLAQAMNVCAIDFPPDRDETAEAGLTLLPGTDVAAPRIAEAPFALECRRVMAIAPGPGREIVIGEVVRLHAREGLLDLTRMRIDAEAYRPVGRLFGNGYARQNDRFDLERETFADWEARRAR